MSLLDARGNPISSVMFRKPTPIAEPKQDAAVGMWAGRDSQFLTLPGGAVMQFDLNRLTLADYRSMRQHYQLGSSLNVLSFIMHQIDWWIDCDNKEIKGFLEEELHHNWTPLIRGFSQAFWAGYSPIAVNYENRDNFTRIARFKDLIPEECCVNWKKVQGWAPPGKVKPTLYEFDGMKQNGFLIPVGNSLWYPLLMENGDHYGRKLLKSAFPAWFFSNLIHLFANRYFERFGEPLPVGRAPFQDEVDLGNGTSMSGKKAMENIVTGIRSRAVTVLPSDRDPLTKEYDYNIEYLESQMRGADFERYLSRLDEEMSLAVFTPVLLFRTADVGSYNLGVQHLKIFQQMLNAISGDMQFYIQNYLVERLKAINFPGSEKITANWVFRPQGPGDLEIYKEIMVEMIRQNLAKADTVELGRIAGLTMTEIEQITAPPPVPGQTDPNADPNAPKPKPKPKVKPPAKVAAAKNVLREAAVRVGRELNNGTTPILGFRNRFMEALVNDGYEQPDAFAFTDNLYLRLNNFIANADIQNGDEMTATLKRLIDFELID
jgi:hypothetical protein